MRALFLILVLANVAFYAWWRHLAGPDPAVDTAPLGREVQPERLKIVPPEEAVRRGAKPAAASADDDKATDARQSSPPAAATSLTPTAASVPACLEWGSFTLVDEPRAQEALAPLALGAKLATRRTEELAKWWVFIPPQGNRQGAVRKAGELKDLGVRDFFIVQDDPRYRWALSLGVFRNEEAAQARLADLRRQGVRSAVAGQRETVVPKVWLQVREVDAGLEARLRAIAVQLEGSELRACR